MRFPKAHRHVVDSQSIPCCCIACILCGHCALALLVTGRRFVATGFEPQNLTILTSSSDRFGVPLFESHSISTCSINPFPLFVNKSPIRYWGFGLLYKHPKFSADSQILVMGKYILFLQGKVPYLLVNYGLAP